MANTASGEFTTDIEKRNARLMSASPELLEALVGICDEYAGISDKWMIAARAAISKATGDAA